MRPPKFVWIPCRRRSPDDQTVRRKIRFLTLWILPGLAIMYGLYSHYVWLSEHIYGISRRREARLDHQDGLERLVPALRQGPHVQGLAQDRRPLRGLRAQLPLRRTRRRTRVLL